MEPSQQQLAVLNFVRNDNRSCVVEARAGSGKCLGRGTPVIMFDGSIKNVEDVKTGDALLGPDSHPRLVSSTSRGTGGLYKITPVKGDPWVCNAEHILTLVNSVTDEVYDTSITEYLDNQGTMRHKDSKLFRVAVDFSENQTTLPSYLVGLWLGDGTTDAPSITAHASEHEIIDYCQRVAIEYEQECFISSDQRFPQVLCLRFRAGPRGSHKPNLIWCGFQECLIEGIKRIPPQYLINSRVERLEVLAGLLDTDGHLSRNCYEICFKHEELANDFLFLARSLGFAATKRLKIVNGTGYTRVMVSGDTNLIPCRCPRKMATTRTQVKNVCRTGFSVDWIGASDYFGFTINGDGRFLLGDFTVTHNTTTLVMLANELPKDRLCLFLAFNKNIATELQQRLPPHIQAKTFHSHCYGALQRNLPRRPKVDENKVFNILKDTLIRRDFETYFKYVSRLVSYAKSYGIGTDLVPDHHSEWFRLIDHFSMIADSGDFNEETAINIARDVLRTSNENVTIIDFDDMLYLALLRNVTFDKCNFVMLDEAQDTNGVQRALLRRMLAAAVPDANMSGGRLIAVGDTFQSIYGFRGADADAMTALKTEFNAVEFPLSVSYRCAQEVVAETRREIPDSIDAHPTAPIGSVEKLLDYDLETFSSDMAILCRVTAPLVTLAFGFIKRNTGVRILGREIGAGLVALVKKMNTQDVDNLSDKLRNWRAREVGKALNRGHESAAAAIDDKYSCLMVFIDQLNEDERTVDELIRRIESLFSDNNRGLLTLCSVHKAKGLEWPTVFILDREEYMPSKWAKQEWQRKQELNLIYVAITRAKLHLRYIKSDRWRKAKTEVRAEDVDEVAQRRRELLETI